MIKCVTFKNSFSSDICYLINAMSYSILSNEKLLLNGIAAIFAVRFLILSFQNFTIFILHFFFFFFFNFVAKLHMKVH